MLHRAFAATVLALVLALPAAAVPLPQVDRDPAVPTPASVLGYEVGDYHARPDQLVRYLEILAEASPRVRLETTGETFEKRPQVLATISSPSNLERIEAIRAAHLALCDPGAPLPDLEAMPVVVFLGYSVHGNEASGANASLLVAYHLASARDPETVALLEHAVVLLDPALNPDGLGRFATWANAHRGRVAVADPDHREHVEGWPSGRTNHYGFDLNRDWLLAQLPETRARLAVFHRWRPNVHADFHEMGTDGTYFFQPGVPSRANPLTPARNLELTREIARYHAAAFDGVGALYYSQETFDDFYYGKGSSYPDVHGAVGILFEQASARGRLQRSERGEVSFATAIRNQTLTSLSTLRAAADKREELLAYQREFYASAPKRAADGTEAYLVGDDGDSARATAFLDLLARHRIVVHRLGRELEAGGERYLPGHAWVVGLDQPQSRLVRSLFEPVRDFADPVFYDVSTWTLPLAFGLPAASLRGRDAAARGEVEGSFEPAGRVEPADGAYAYAFEWRSSLAPRALGALLAAGVRAQVATRPLRVTTAGGERELGRGAVVIPAGGQEVDAVRLREALVDAAARSGLEVLAVSTGLAGAGGVDLGSPSVPPLAPPRPAILVGGEVSVYEAGELWHLLDERLELATVLLASERLRRADLGAITHLFLVGGAGGFDEATTERLRAWIHAGGTLVATKSAAVWAGEALLPKPEGPKADAAAQAAAPAPERRPYAERERDEAEELVAGAIFEVDLDLTHPLAFGYRRPRLPVFRDHTDVLPAARDPYSAVAVYTDAPLLSGFASEKNVAKVRATPALLADRLGDGLLVRLADDPAFRGVWYGTARLVANALFFSGAVAEAE